MMNTFVKPFAGLLLCLSLGFSATALAAKEATANMPTVQQTDIKIGTGEVVTRFSTPSVHYTGKLMDGTKFDSSLDRDKPFQFTVGAGKVIPGWEMGVIGMKVGGIRELVIPSQLAYGKRGAGGVIPPDATLKFEIELLAVEPAKFASIDNSELKTMLARGAKLVDIRRPDEWKQTGVVEGSILMTAFDSRGRIMKGFPDSFFEQFSAEDEVVLICRTGNRTSVLSNLLSTQAGFTNIFNVEHGITHWIKERGPVVKAKL